MTVAGGLAGDATLAAMMAIETVFPPLAGPVLPLAGVAVADGSAEFLSTVAAATVGSTVGALVLYEASRAVGARRVRDSLLRRSRWSSLSVQHFTQAEQWFVRHQDAAVLLGRCVPVIRSLISIPAGLERMGRVRFVLLTAVGNSLWAAMVVGGAALASRHLPFVAQHLRLVQLAVVCLWLLVLVSVALLRRSRSSPRHVAAGPEPSSPGRSIPAIDSQQWTPNSD